MSEPRIDVMRPGVLDKFFLTREIVLRLLSCGAICAILCPALREPGIAIDVPTQNCLVKHWDYVV